MNRRDVEAVPLVHGQQKPAQTASRGQMFGANGKIWVMVVIVICGLAGTLLITKKGNHSFGNMYMPFFETTSSEPDTTITSSVYMDLSVDGSYAGRVIIGLYGNEVPITTENFRSLCTGERGMGTMGEQLSYVGTPFHRIIPSFMIQGGDITTHDGYGGESIYGKTFADENFNVKFDKVGLVAMANAGPNTQGSQFFITTVETSWLNGAHVIFGEVTDNYELVKTVESLGTDSGAPSKTVTITASGMYDSANPPATPSAVAPVDSAGPDASAKKRPSGGSGSPPSPQHK